MGLGSRFRFSLRGLKGMVLVKKIPTLAGMDPSILHFQLITSPYHSPQPSNKYSIPSGGLEYLAATVKMARAMSI